MSFSSKAIRYFLRLKSPAEFPGGVKVLNPYVLAEVKKVVKNFYNTYYNDSNKRIYMIGINPGRFGGGLTGIAFTDPVALRVYCGIKNELGAKAELSSLFVYEMINDFGGVDRFFPNVFMTALFPLALLSNGKNFNYYDDKKLFDIIKPELIKSLQSQIKFGALSDKAIILGKKNADYFKRINDEFRFFEDFTVLDHPRYIMQYKLRKKNYYKQLYIEQIKTILISN